VNAKTAEKLFKVVREETTVDDFILQASSSWKLEVGDNGKTVGRKGALHKLQQDVDESLGTEWREKIDNAVTRRAIVLIYAHLLRLPVEDYALKEEQRRLLLHSPSILTCLLSISLSHNWLVPSLNIMHLHAYLAQALLPGAQPLALFPGVQKEEVENTHGDFSHLVKNLEAKGDRRVGTLKKVAERWGHVELVDAQFKVIGEKIVTPGAIVQLLIRLRLTPPGSKHNGSASKEEDIDQIKQEIKANEEKDATFLTSRKDAEDLETGQQGTGWAHAPYWPANRKPSWWAVVGDLKLNRVIVPPLKLTDIPYDDPSKSRNYRTYKIQFQAPPQVGSYTWRLSIVSDTYVGEDAYRDLTLKIDDVSALGAEGEVAEDEISEPDEDTLAGQMAAMRGGKVKKKAASSDDESTTDNDESSASSSDSDSD